MSKAGRYGYSNTRVKAMEAKLISRATMQSVLNSTDVSSILAILFQTDYKKSITDYGGMEIKNELIDFALSKNLAEHVYKLRTISPGEDKETVRAIIGKWDLYNIKLALEAKGRKLDFDAIAKYVVDYGFYNHATLKEIIRETSVEGMLNRFMVNSPYKGLLQSAYAVYEKNKNISEVIAAIDKGYYDGLSRAIRKLAYIDRSSSTVIKMEIDVVNLLTLIRAKKLGLKLQEIENDLIDNGRMERKGLLRLYGSAQNLEGLIQQIREFNLSDALSVYNKNRQLLTFEISMKNKVFDMSMRLLRHAVLSFGTIVAYLYLKEIEVYTLRIAINSKYYGLSKEDISRLIIWKV